MNTTNRFSRFHHWMRGVNANVVLTLNCFPEWWVSPVNIHGEVYYHHSPTPESLLTVQSSPFFLPYPRRIDNNFLKHLCLLAPARVRSYLSFQLQKFVENGGDRDDWLHHTTNIITAFLENAESVSSKSSNFWDSSEIVRAYRLNTYAALGLLGQKEFACNA